MVFVQLTMLSIQSKIYGELLRISYYLSERLQCQTKMARPLYITFIPLKKLHPKFYCKTTIKDGHTFLTKTFLTATNPKAAFWAYVC